MYNSTPVEQYYDTPVQQYNSTMYNSTQVEQYYGTPVQQYNSTPVKLQCKTTLSTVKILIIMFLKG